MSKRSKGVAFGEDAKARFKHQTLMQDYLELQKETDSMRNKLEAAKQRKLMLAAEVRFLRRRYKSLVRTKTVNSSQEQNFVPGAHLLKQTKNIKEHLLSRKGSSQHRLPPVQESKSKKKHQLAPHGASPIIDRPRKKILRSGIETNKRSCTSVTDSNHNGKIHNKKESSSRNTTAAFDLNRNERMNSSNDAALRNSFRGFDLNQGSSSPGWQEASLPSRHPIFDLNEISTGDEDFQSSVEPVKLEDMKKTVIRSLNEEQQNDLKLSICRNAGEGSSRAGKRKISWQDPVALRV